MERENFIAQDSSGEGGGGGGEGLGGVMKVYLASQEEIVLSFETYVHNIATVGQQERTNYLTR